MTNNFRSLVIAGGLAMVIASCGPSENKTVEETDTTERILLDPVETNAPNTDYPPAFEGQTRAPGTETTTAYEGRILSEDLKSPWGITSWFKKGVVDACGMRKPAVEENAIT